MADRLDPTDERLKWGNVRPVDLYRTEGPERVRVYRMTDLLGAMLKRGTIDQAMAHAGRRFQGLFHSAGLDGAARLSLVRVSGNRGGLPERTLEARREVHVVLASLGGLSSLPSRSLWDVLGIGYSIRDFGYRAGLGEEVARGVFIGALSCLAEYLDKGRGRFVGLS